MTFLTDLRTGDTFSMGLRVTSRDVTGLGCNVYTTTRTQQGTLQLGQDGTMAGSWLNPVNQVPVNLLNQAFVAGDVVINDRTGETYVVRFARLGLLGWEWSTATTNGPVYTTTGWTVVGTATITGGL